MASPNKYKSIKHKRWESQKAERHKIRMVWLVAMGNMPVASKGVLIAPALPLALCLEISKNKVLLKYEQGAKLANERWQMLIKLAHPEYGRVFAAIRLAALGVADQYDWDDR